VSDGNLNGRSQLELLKDHGIKPTRKRGQNFLVDGNLARAIAADVTALSGDVLELGAGGGALTRPLLESGARVRAVEVDRGLCAVLREEFGADPAFALVEADLAKLDWGAELHRAGTRPVLAGNLPYVLTSAVLFALADHREQAAGGVFMVQKEVADRLVAAPGGKEYGVLSVVLGSLFDVELVRTVPRTVFWPRPDVTSAVVRLAPNAEAWNAAELADFKDVVKTLFQQRRKQLHRILRSRLGDADAAAAALAAADLDPAARPEQIPRDRLRLLARSVVAQEAS